MHSGSMRTVHMMPVFCIVFSLAYSEAPVPCLMSKGRDGVLNFVISCLRWSSLQNAAIKAYLAGMAGSIRNGEND